MTTETTPQEAARVEPVVGRLTALDEACYANEEAEKELAQLRREMGECLTGWETGTRAIAENSILRAALEAVKEWDIAHALERKSTLFALPHEVRQKIQNALTPNTEQALVTGTLGPAIKNRTTR